MSYNCKHFFSPSPSKCLGVGNYLDTHDLSKERFTHTATKGAPFTLYATREIILNYEQYPRFSCGSNILEMWLEYLLL